MAEMRNICKEQKRGSEKMELLTEVEIIKTVIW